MVGVLHDAVRFRHAPQLKRPEHPINAGYKAESNGVPRREGFLHRALHRGCVASMLVGVEQYQQRLGALMGRPIRPEDL